MTPSQALLTAPRVYAGKTSLCGAIIVLGDAIGLMIAFGLAALCRWSLTVPGWDGDLDPFLYLRISPILLLFPAVYTLFGLYPGVTFSPVRELRQLSGATTMVFVVLATLLFLFKEGPTYSRFIFGLAWILALLLVPLDRAAVRVTFGDRPWWGFPVAVFGTGHDAVSLVEGLQARPSLGLRPAVLVGQAAPALRDRLRGVAFVSDLTAAPALARSLQLNHAVVVMSELRRDEVSRFLESHTDTFSHVYVIPGLHGLSSLGVETREFCNMLALELRRSLLLPGRQTVKAVLDRGSAIAGGLLLLPFLALIALLVRLESKGPVFFGQKRIGRRGETFLMWKFRTMHTDGDRILGDFFTANPEARAEWESTQKLQEDPRVTRVGRILRKTSLDELPQLWNVVLGEMSLVGPRPIVSAEIPRYGEWFDLYCRVVPGLTGLWQVSGRSRTTYEQRVELDTYYVRNWSPWFDVYLLARTVRIVLRGEGAY